MRRINLDHNATTSMKDAVRARFMEVLDEFGGNASSTHASGRRARQILDECREQAAAALEIGEDELFFCSGGTECNNAALFGVLRPLGPQAALVTTSIEHPSVMLPAGQLQTEGHHVEYLPVDGQGRMIAGALQQALGAEKVGLVSVMLANNEIGVINDLAPIAAAACGQPVDNRPVFHTDATQALGRVPIELVEWGVGLASFSMHKIGGPLGCGLLYVRRDVQLAPLMHGGGQESDRRPGTENLPAIVASALAVELAVKERENFHERVSGLALTLWMGIKEAIPSARLIGPAIEDSDRLPNTLNIHVPGSDGRVLVTRLDLAGLEVSTGSACSSGSLEPSHVLLALGLSDEDARAGIRLSLGSHTSGADIHSAVDILRKTLRPERKSPTFSEPRR